MAAFCACCGAEITGKAEACTVCGMPRHGMIRADKLPPLDLDSTAPASEPDSPLGAPFPGCCTWQA